MLGVAEGAPRLAPVLGAIEHRAGAALVLVARERGGRARHGEGMRRPRVDAHGPRVARRDAPPRIAPGGAAVVGAEDAGIALDHLGDPVEPPVARRREQHLGLRRVRRHHVDVRIAAGEIDAPRGPAIVGARDAAHLDAHPDPLGIGAVDDEGPRPTTLARRDGDAPPLGARRLRERLHLLPGPPGVGAPVEAGGLRAHVDVVAGVRPGQDVPHRPPLDAARLPRVAAVVGGEDARVGPGEEPVARAREVAHAPLGQDRGGLVRLPDREYPFARAGQELHRMPPWTGRFSRRPVRVGPILPPRRWTRQGVARLGLIAVVVSLRASSKRRSTSSSSASVMMRGGQRAIVS